MNTHPPTITTTTTSPHPHPALTLHHHLLTVPISLPRRCVAAVQALTRGTNTGKAMVKLAAPSNPAYKCD